jgi:hypothetical protein
MLQTHLMAFTLPPGTFMYAVSYLDITIRYIYEYEYVYERKRKGHFKMILDFGIEHVNILSISCLG